MADSLASLRKLDLFGAMSERAFTRLAHACYLHRLPANTTLVSQGQIPDSAHIVFSGAIEAVAHYGERETVVAIRHAPASICFAAAAERLPSLCTVRVCADARVLFVPGKALRNALKVDLAFARALLRLSVLIGRDYIMELKNQKLRTGPERLAAWLLRHRNGKTRSFAFTLPYDKRRLASRLGMTPENLSRTFTVLRAHGVKLEQTRIVVSDSSSLTRFARPDDTIDHHRM